MSVFWNRPACQTETRGTRPPFPEDHPPAETVHPCDPSEGLVPVRLPLSLSRYRPSCLTLQPNEPAPQLARGCPTSPRRSWHSRVSLAAQRLPHPGPLCVRRPAFPPRRRSGTRKFTDTSPICVPKISISDLQYADTFGTSRLQTFGCQVPKRAF